MLLKLAAAVVLTGLCLPYAGDVRPVAGIWGSPASAALLGVPMLAAVLYVFRELVPPVARAFDGHGPAAHGVLRVTFIVLAATVLLKAIQADATPSQRLGIAVALLLAGGVLAWQQGRGTTAQRVPLLLLAIVGIPVVGLAVVRQFELQPGGWILTGGWALAVLEEMRLLRATPAIGHGG
jgi:uncharacterized protein (DUF983 family)